jgi:PAS domain-containing protein
MLPSSHPIPIIPASGERLPDPQVLASAFSEFISASSLLEASYRDLQQEVARLNSELARRNAALSRSRVENDHMRAALQQMLDSMPCGVLVVNYAAQIAMINPEGRRLLELGDLRIHTLADLSQISQVDFESLENHPEDGLDREVCVQSNGGMRWLAIGNRKLRCD